MRGTWTTTFLLAGLLLVTIPTSLAHSAHDLDEANSFHGDTYAATIAGFQPAVVAIPSGSTLGWSAVDVTHTFTEGTVSLAATNPCVDITFSPSGLLQPGAEATFTITSSGSYGTGAAELVAREAGSSETKTCTTATVTDNVAVMRFWCTIHGWMDGLLVVYDAEVLSQAQAMNHPAVALQLPSAA